MTRRTRAEASASKVAAADLAGRKPKRVIHRTDSEGFESFLQLRRPERVVPLPEPVVVPVLVNGRPPRDWEGELYREAMGRERRAELELFRGLIS